MYKIKYSKKAIRDIKLLRATNLGMRAKQLISLITENPYKNPPPYEKLLGELTGKLSRRINRQHRIVYEVFESEKIIKIISLWSHYEF
jgi:Txe/YoeB family toxin of toxin-antitoxin system